MLLGQLEPIGIHVGDDDIPGPGMPDDGCRHDADRPGAGDQDVFAEHGKRQGRVHRVAERVEDRLHVARNLRRVKPDVGHRQGEILGKRSRPIDADALGVFAEMPAAGEAVAAAAADDVPLAADDVADVKVLDIRADFDDPADKLMAHHHRHGDRLLGPGVPFVDVHVGAADAGPQDLDQHIVDADLGHGDVVEPEARLGVFFDEGFHRWLS